MNRYPAASLAVLLLAGCGDPLREYSAPAPAGALDCALREAEEMGYARMEGLRDAGYVRVSQRAELPAEIREQARDPLPGTQAVRPIPEDPPTYNELMLREDDGRLRIQVVGRLHGEVVEPATEAETHAERILAACTTG